MPTTRNVAWDERLESFKGRDTTHYVATAAGLAKTCAVCRGPLSAIDPVSLLVDILHSTAPNGTEYLTFTDYVCHRRCSAPAVRVEHVPWRPDTVSPIAARVILAHKTPSGAGPGVPVLAYTLEPVVSFREPGGELTSALVSLLLARGFQLAMTSSYAHILQLARPVGAECRFTLTAQGLLRLTIEEETLYREQLHPGQTDDAEWLQAVAHTRHILVVSGDNITITDTGLNINDAARHGTLVVGTVTVDREGSLRDAP